MVQHCTVRNEDELVETTRCMLRHSLPIAEYLIEKQDEHPGRTALGLLLQESRRLEELLDAYGARTNRAWLPFRRVVAAVKLFCDVHYKLLHLKYSIPLYALLPLEEDIDVSTATALERSRRLLSTTLRNFLDSAERNGLYPEVEPYQPRCIEDEEVTWRLPNDLTRTALTYSPGETVVSLATTFLNTVEGSDLRELHSTILERGFASCVPAMACEEDFRRYEDVFHNLQALYDSYVGGTDLERTDENLGYLRGHATIAYHLFEIVTALTHHYERHLLAPEDATTQEEQRASGAEPDRSARIDDISWIVVSYATTFAVRYATGVQDLCRKLIRRYTEDTAISVPAPPYRGFHVRPSTLIARIVRHYGSEVTLQLEEERCDASSPLEMIRVNERINALKRRSIGHELMQVLKEQSNGRDFQSALHETITELYRRHKIVIYAQELGLARIEPSDSEPLGEYARRALAQLLAEGRIDIQAEIHVTFQGDKRALDDIALLARSGYGEDRLGENIPLPPALSYLKR